MSPPSLHSPDLQKRLPLNLFGLRKAVAYNLATGATSLRARQSFRPIRIWPSRLVGLQSFLGQLLQ
ncbi:hypothetical protein DFAR_3360023 [Desulfarculales bacterium]